MCASCASRGAACCHPADGQELDANTPPETWDAATAGGRHLAYRGVHDDIRSRMPLTVC